MPEWAFVALGSNLGDRDVQEPGLRIPHPELPNRAFLLRELAELESYVE